MFGSIVIYYFLLSIILYFPLLLLFSGLETFVPESMSVVRQNGEMFFLVLFVFHLYFTYLCAKKRIQMDAGVLNGLKLAFKELIFSVKMMVGLK